MKIPYAFIPLAMVAAIAMGFGCNEERNKAIDSALFVYKDELHHSQSDKDNILPPADYREKYLERVINFLESRPSLNLPYMVSMEIDYQPNRKEGSGMGVRWCEYKTMSVGLVLKAIVSSGKQEWRLPVFENRYKDPELHQMYHRTVAQSHLIIIEPSKDVAPSLKPQIATPENPFPRPVVEFPLSLLSADMEVAIYDNKGHVSNFVPVFVWPIEKAEEKPNEGNPVVNPK